MATKYMVFIAACFLLTLTQAYGQEVQAVNGKVKLSIGTTAGCSDTVRFINNQLVETHRLYGDFLEIEFVPWGRTTFTNGVFWCQFGEPDCWANRLHRCVLNILKDNQDAQVEYMACEFSHPFPGFERSYVCAQAIGVSLVDVDYCVAHPGDELDTAAQTAAAGPMLSVNFVPYIVFNGVATRPLTDEAMIRLSSMICFALAADPTTGVTNCQI